MAEASPRGPEATDHVPGRFDVVAEQLVGLADALRADGVGVGVGQVVGFVEAVTALAPPDIHDLYWSARTCLVTDHRDLPTFERVFSAYFVADEPALELATEGHAGEPVTATAGAGSMSRMAGDDDPDTETIGAVASEVEVLRTRRFDHCSDAELQAIRRLMRRIELAVPYRVTRRMRRSSRRGRMDLRRSLHRALQTDGEIVERAWRRRRTRARPLVLLLDVSGSMAGFSRALLQFAFSTRSRVERVEVLCFGTRLTRLTDLLRGRDVDAAVTAAATAVVDWDGGTRIGASLAELNRVWARRGLLRGAVVVILSDGLERGDPDLLADEMARLSRAAHRVVWVNPLKADDRYQPLARGMSAALPYVDRFVPGHDLASLEALAGVVSALPR